MGPLFRALGAAIALPALACTGTIDPAGGPGAATATSGARGPEGRPTAPPGGGWGGPAVTTPGAPSATPACVPDPGPQLVRRLSNPEYQNTLRDLLHETRDLTTDFPQDALILGFDNNADAANISPTHALQYKLAAERAAADAVAPALRVQLVGCDLASVADRTTCLRTFIERFGRRAYRRPLAAVERDALVTLARGASDAADPYVPVRVVLEALLQSPSFLFRAEIGSPDPGRPGLARLTGFEVATRLSYALFRTTPPDALLDAAASGELDTPAGIETHALAMMKDPRALDGLRSFYNQWLQTSTIDEITRDPAAYPSWSDALMPVLKEEVRRMFDPLFTTPAANFLDFLTTRDVWVDPNLARLYGVTAPPRGTWARAQLDGTRRAGLLTMASMLVPSANGNSIAMPIHRGAFVREVLFCTPLPAIPANVPDLPEKPSASQSDRERLEAHDRSPACASCHQLFDPIGFGLSNFDAVGAWRTTDSAGKPIDAHGRIFGVDDGDFEGGVQLGQKLRSAPQVSGCVVETFFRYTQGRDVGDADACTMTGLGQVFAAGGNRFQDMMLAFLKSDAFRYRHPQQGATP